jgi:hypothetical protein
MQAKQLLGKEMRKLPIVIVVVLVVIGCIYRYVQVFPYPIGTGDEATSPDGQFVASVTQYYDENFWGVSESWIEFEISPTRSGVPVRTLVTQPIPGAIFGSRTDTEVVFWAPDSKEVDFMFPGVHVKLEVELEQP